MGKQAEVVQRPEAWRDESAPVVTRIAFVSGGMGGIGSAICRRLGRAGPHRGRRLPAGIREEGRVARAHARRGPARARRRGRRRRVRFLRRDVLQRALGGRPGRHPGQQRRHHARLGVQAHDRAGLDGGDQHQPEQRVQRHPPGDRRHERARLGPHHQHLVGQRDQGPVRPDQLLGGQGRHGRASPRRSRRKW